MTRISAPLFTIYTVHAYFKKGEQNMFSFMLHTAVGYIYTYGFICMVPQLYVNYRNKSVVGMSKMTLFYCLLNTIIDDLFAFLQPMPTL